jgi:tryptophanyl-tRNA synthetase
MDIHPAYAAEIQNPPLLPNHRRREIPRQRRADLKETAKWSYENALDLIALGFKPEDTFIIYDTKDIDLLYDITLEVARRITYSTARSTFGFQDSTNIGWVFWPAIQAAPCFIHKKLTGENVPALIPAAIDQDPYWRVTRDIAQKLGYYKPAQIHCRFLPGLGAGGKMSASMPETSIFTLDPLMCEKKKSERLHGGKGTAAEQRKLGADPHLQHIPVLPVPLRRRQRHAGRTGTQMPRRRDALRRMQKRHRRKTQQIPRSPQGKTGKSQRHN